MVIRAGMFTIEGKDKKGRPVLWYRPELLKGSETVINKNKLKQLNIFYIEKLDKQYPNEGWDLAIDCSKVTKENIDMEFYLFLTKVYMVYYPRTVKYIFAMYVPPVISDVPKTIMDLMGEEFRSRHKFPKYKELTDNYIDANNVPSYVTQI